MLGPSLPLLDVGDGDRTPLSGLPASFSASVLGDPASLLLLLLLVAGLEEEAAVLAE